MDSEKLDAWISTKCKNDCRIISGGTGISNTEKAQLVKAVGQNLFNELENIAKEVHGSSLVGG